MYLSRRALLAGSAAYLAARPSPAASAIDQRFAQIEANCGGRLGVAALDTESDRRLDYRSDRLWPLCGSFKFLLAAAVLARIDAGQESFDRIIKFGPAELLDYAPVVKPRLSQGGMSVGELCEASVTQGDHSATNLLLPTVGGPGGLTVFLRSLGDRTTHIDRSEPFINEALPGDSRDTSSPAAMLGNMGTLLLQNALSVASRSVLNRWLEASVTGKNFLGGGLPSEWRIGHKAGAGAHGAINDIVIARPPGRGPLLIAAYYTDSDAELTDRIALMAEVGRIVTDSLIAGS